LRGVAGEERCGGGFGGNDGDIIGHIPVVVDTLKVVFCGSESVVESDDTWIFGFLFTEDAKTRDLCAELSSQFRDKFHGLSETINHRRMNNRLNFLRPTTFIQLYSALTGFGTYHTNSFSKLVSLRKRLHSLFNRNVVIAVVNV